MKTWVKVVLGLFLIGVVAAGIILYIAFKKPPTAADSKPVKELTSEQMIAEFQKNKKLADSMYMYKNIGVSGKIKDVSNMSIFLEAGEGAAIQCSFDSSLFVKNTPKFTKGASIKIKGIYYASDGFEEKAGSTQADNEMDLLDEIKENVVHLKTCAINE